MYYITRNDMKSKDLFILGTARSGKTSLAKKIHENFNYSIISIDSFVDAFSINFSSLGISHHNTDKKDDLLAPFVYSYYEKIKNEYPEQNFVIEGWHVYPKTINNLLEQENVQIICLGNIAIGPEEKLADIRKYADHRDYTVKMTDDDVMKLITNHLKFARILKHQCDVCGFPFYDTSYNRESVLDSIIEDIGLMNNTINLRHKKIRKLYR